MNKGFYTIDYYGENFCGMPSHIWELHDYTGKLLYQLCDVIGENQTENVIAHKEFMRRCDLIMDKSSAENTIKS